MFRRRNWASRKLGPYRKGDCRSFWRLDVGAAMVDVCRPLMRLVDHLFSVESVRPVIVRLKPVAADTAAFADDSAGQGGRPSKSSDRKEN